MDKPVYINIETLTKIVEVAKKYDLPETPVIVFAILESVVTELGVFLSMKNPDNFGKFLKEVAEFTRVPLTDEQLKVYITRTKEMTKAIEKKKVE